MCNCPAVDGFDIKSKRKFKSLSIFMIGNKILLHIGNGLLLSKGNHYHSHSLLSPQVKLRLSAINLYVEAKLSEGRGQVLSQSLCGWIPLL